MLSPSFFVNKFLFQATLPPFRSEIGYWLGAASLGGTGGDYSTCQWLQSKGNWKRAMQELVDDLCW